MKVSHAMLLAAGLGTRMRPLTDSTAKPLLPLGGRSLLDHGLDRLLAAGVETVVINTHWFADLVAARIAERRCSMRLILRREAELLETGGGVAAALRAGDLGDQPFFVVNGDAFWLDGPVPALARMMDGWQPGAMDGFLLVHRTFQVQADVGFGDFALDKWGAPRRRAEREIVPYIYAGVQLASPTLFRDVPDGRFSMNLLWDRAIEANRLRAIVHDGLWFHLSTPADLSDAERSLQIRESADTR